MSWGEGEVTVAANGRNDVVGEKERGALGWVAGASWANARTRQSVRGWEFLLRVGSGQDSLRWRLRGTEAAGLGSDSFEWSLQ